MSISEGNTKVSDPQPQPQEREMEPWDWEPRHHTHTDSCYPQGFWLPSAKEVCGFIGPRATGRPLKCIPVIRLQYLESQERQVAALTAENAQLREEAQKWREAANEEGEWEARYAKLAESDNIALSTLQQHLRALEGCLPQMIDPSGQDVPFTAVPTALLRSLLASSRQDK